MAQRIGLHYVPGTSPLHRWDGRCKFFGLLIISATLLPAKTPWFIFDSILLVGLLILSRLPLKPFFRNLRLWLIFISILFLFQVFFTPGTRVSSLPWLPISQEGVHLGGFTCWRLGLILSYAILFTGVTRPRELQDSLIWVLKPIPFLSGRRIGLMVSLTLRFFSIILDQAEEVQHAHRTRLGDQIRNPIRRAKSLAFPLLRRSFSRAEEVTLALAARGYRDDLPLQLQKLPIPHLIPLWIFLGVAAFIGWF